MVNTIAAQRNHELRALWKSQAAYWRPEDLCFVDETAAAPKTGERKRGWSPKGLNCEVIKVLSRSERYSVLPALTIGGFLADPLVIQGSITKQIFKWWILYSVLPLLRHGMIIIMDNAAIHHNLEIDEILAERGIQIKYLPPYSPDLNPIENTFHTLKEWLRRHWNEAGAFNDFEEFLTYALKVCVGSDCRGYFRNCGYE